MEYEASQLFKTNYAGLSSPWQLLFNVQDPYLCVIAYQGVLLH